MWEWLADQNAAGATMVAAIGAALIWQVSGLARALRHAAAELQQQLKQEGNERREETRAQHETTRREIRTLANGLPGRRRASQAGSPLKLTDFGKEIRTSLDAEDWVAEQARILRPDTAGLEPFEIDQLCQKRIRQAVGGGVATEVQRKAQRIAYERGCDTHAVEDVLRILLRDALLPEPAHPQETREKP